MYLFLAILCFIFVKLLDLRDHMAMDHKKKLCQQCQRYNDRLYIVGWSIYIQCEKEAFEWCKAHNFQCYDTTSKYMHVVMDMVCERTHYLSMWQYVREKTEYEMMQMGVALYGETKDWYNINGYGNTQEIFRSLGEYYMYYYAKGETNPDILKLVPSKDDPATYQYEDAIGHKHFRKGTPPEIEYKDEPK